LIDPCHVLPQFLYPTSNQTLEQALGSQVTLNCTCGRCQPVSFLLLRFSDNGTETFVSSTLEVNVTTDENYGVFACLIRNSKAVFTLQKSGNVHLLAVGALVIAVLLLLIAVMYVKCRLNVLLWYRNHYGELEINDGKLYDAYVSYANSADDRKFVNFIVKPQLENRHGYKLFLDDKDILPNSEPSADLIMNVSRCRRLIVVLSNAYLEQEWCSNNFREGLWRLLELSQTPIFIAFESQYREITHPAINLLKQHKSAVILLVWRAGSMMPSSDFWKELCLALPRKVSYHGLRGDPQTHLQEDKDPMLILHSSYLDFRRDSHPEGDTGNGCHQSFENTAVSLVWMPHHCPLPSLLPSLSHPTAIRGAIFKGPPPHCMTVQLGEKQRSEIDISDLGSRSYEARTDFYCLVTEDDI
uniref:Single Ig and TIR domain containing n=1 Tax=Varanus komodoensis TaxID=61221 RepID=A0A8D2IVE9_VARKO